MALTLCEGQPQRQLTILADVAIDKVFQHRRYVAAFKPEAAQYFLRDGVRNILGSVGIGATLRADRT